MSPKFSRIFLLLILSSWQVKALMPLVPFNEPVGQTRLESSKYKTDFGILAMNYEPQSNRLFCGPASGAIVLNAIRSNLKNSNQLPVDSRDFKTDEFNNLPQNFNPYFSRYTQKTFFNENTNSVKTMSEVLGATLTQHVGDKPDFGLSLRQFGKILAVHNLKVEVVVADQAIINFKILKKEILKNLRTPNNFVVVNYLRSALGQMGGGHFSPIAAYDQVSDSFLILDVNPSPSTPWVWVNANDLINAMNTRDDKENRGVVFVEEL